MSAYTKALRLLGEAERTLEAERKRDLTKYAAGEAADIRAEIARLELRVSTLREVLRGENN